MFKRFPAIGFLINAFLASFLLNRCTHFINRWGYWYSPQFVLRLQTEALLQGRLALDSSHAVPFPDVVWRNGLHHVWGLGVPLLRCPFEIVARMAGFPAFPDRLVLLIYFGLITAYLLKSSFDGVKTTHPSMKNPSPSFENMGFVIAMAFAPPFVVLLNTRFTLWEEPVAYGYLWSIFLLGLIIGYVARNTYPKYLILAFLSGFSPLIRPTLLAYGIATMGLALLISMYRGVSVKRSISAGVVFLIPLIFLFWTNAIRFGHFLEFGHALNVADEIVLLSSTKFSYPFQAEPFFSAAKELFGCLFFIRRFNGFEFYKSSLFTGQSPTLRFREFYFDTYTPITLLLMSLGWLMTLRHVVQERKYGRLSLILTWSFTSFLMLFLFYLRSPSFTSRYAIDFLAAIIAAITLLWGLFSRWANQKSAWLTLAGFFFFVLWISIGIKNGRADPTHGQMESVTWNHLHHAMSVPSQNPLPPSFYSRGQKRFNEGSLFYNETGWNVEGDGAVDPVVILFFHNPGAITLRMKPKPGQWVSEKDWSSIQVRVGSEHFYVSRCIKSGDMRTLFFDKNPNSPSIEGLQVVFIEFVATADLGKRTPPFILDNVSTN